MMEAAALSLVLVQSVPATPIPDDLRPNPRTDLVDRKTPEQQQLLVPKWTGSPDELKAAEETCQRTFGPAAAVRLQNGYASCCRTADLAFGLCDSLTAR